MIPKLLSRILMTTCLVAMPSVAKHLDVLWVGNSLLASVSCTPVNWSRSSQWYAAMVNTDSAVTGISLTPAEVSFGATSLVGQWKDHPETDISSARYQLQTPTGYPDDNAAVKDKGHYDYVVLEDDFLITPGQKNPPMPLDSNFKYASLLSEMALAHGTIPVYFVTWCDDSSQYNRVVWYYDSLYRKYKNRGALIAPVYQTHKLIYQDPSIANAYPYLYQSDNHHTNSRGGVIEMCVFSEVLTRHSCVGYDFAKAGVAMCSWSGGVINAPSNTDITYLEGKSHQAVVNYYGNGWYGGTGVANEVHNALRPLATDRVSHVTGRTNVYDIRGRAIGSETPAIAGLYIRLTPDGRMVTAKR